MKSVFDKLSQIFFYLLRWQKIVETDEKLSVTDKNSEIGDMMTYDRIENENMKY